MIAFIESPIYQNWLQKQNPKKSIYISSPFIKKQALTRLLSFYDFEYNAEKIKLVIIMRALEDDFIRGSSDISALEYIMSLQEKYPQSIEAKVVNNLHMKAYMIDEEKLLISSGNLTPRGLYNFEYNGNAEGGIATDDSSACKKFLEYFYKIFNSGVDLSIYIQSLKIGKIKKKDSEKSSKQKISETYMFSIPKPTVLLDYPKDNTETTEFTKFIIKNTVSSQIDDQQLRNIIPQLATIENYYKTIEFITNTDSDECNMEKLASYLGSAAKKQSDRNRKVSGIIQNLKLLGFVEDASVKSGHLPQVTSIGEKYINVAESERDSILKEQSENFLWLQHIKTLRKENPNIPLRQIIIEYLCNKPFEYAESSAERYVGTMLRFCKLHGIE